MFAWVPPRPDLTQPCRYDPEDIHVCGKAPTNFSTCWTCSLDLTAADKLVLTFAVVVWLDPGNGMSVPFREHKGRRKVSQLLPL